MNGWEVIYFVWGRIEMTMKRGDELKVFVISRFDLKFVVVDNHCSVTGICW